MDSDLGFKEDSRYQFRYALFSVLVELKGEYILVKTSTKTEIIPRHQMNCFYAPIIRGESYRELIIAYQAHGKLKRARIFSNLGEIGFDQFLCDLRQELPQGDLSNLTPQNAYLRLGIRELSWVAIPSLMLLGTFLVALLASPYLLHGLEEKVTELDFIALEHSVDVKENISAHYISVQGILDLDHMIEKGRRARGYELIVPLYATQDSLHSNSPVILVQISGSTDLQLDFLSKQRHFKGIKRSIFWEGLSVKERRQLQERGVNLSADPFLLELNVSPSDDLTLYSVLILILLGLTFGVWWSLKPIK